MWAGSTPAIAIETTFANGFNLSLLTKEISGL